MAFSIITGTMGGGKSYYAAEITLDAFKRGAVVHTCGVDLVPQVVEGMGFLHQWVNLTPPKDMELADVLKETQTWPGRIRPGVEGNENVLIVDEASLVFSVDKQASAKDSKADLFQMLVWSRRYGLDVYFIAQHAANLDVKLRRMAAYHYHCLDVEKVPVIGPVWAIIRGKFRRSVLNVKGAPLTCSYHRMNAEVCRLYDTHGFAGRDKPEGLEDRRTVATVKKKKSFGILYVVLGIFAVMAWSCSRLGDTTRELSKVVVAPGRSSAPAVSVNANANAEYEPGIFNSGLVQTPPPLASVYDIKDQIVTTVSGPSARRSLRTVSGHTYRLGERVPGGRVVQIWAEMPGQWVVTLDTGSRVNLRKISPHERHQIWTTKQSSSLQPVPGFSPSPLTPTSTGFLQSQPMTNEAVNQ